MCVCVCVCVCVCECEEDVISSDEERLHGSLDST